MRIAKHPTLDIFAREDGAVLLPSCVRHPVPDWTFGRKNNKGYMEVTNMKGGHRHNHIRNALERKLNRSKASRKRCHNHLNKAYNYKFTAGRCLRRQSNG